MAKKKKNKQSQHQKQKLAQAQHKNDFFRKLHYIIKAYCSEDIFHLIPIDLLKKAYALRYRTPEIIAADGQDISAKDLKDYSDEILDRFNVTKIELSTGNEISLYDFLTVGLTALRMSFFCKNENFAQSEKVKAVLSEFQGEERYASLANDEFYTILSLAGIMGSRLDKCLFWFKHIVDNDKKVKWGGRVYIELYKEIPETTLVVINDIARPVRELCWSEAYKGLKHLSIKPSDLNIENASDDTPMKVYIQSHALNRLYERLDIIPEFALDYSAYLAFTDMKVCRNANNNILVEFIISERKVGYLIVDIVDNKIIIRTFLFLTNSGTPEGSLLEQNTGLKKLDKKYLEIDKLSTFMSEDIENNKEVRKIFEEAGCHSLLGISEITEGLDIELSGKPVSDQILKYLKVNMSSPVEFSL